MKKLDFVFFYMFTLFYIFLYVFLFDHGPVFIAQNFDLSNYYMELFSSKNSTYLSGSSFILEFQHIASIITAVTIVINMRFIIGFITSLIIILMNPYIIYYKLIDTFYFGGEFQVNIMNYFILHITISIISTIIYIILNLYLKKKSDICFYSGKNYLIYRSLSKSILLYFYLVGIFSFIVPLYQI